MRVTRTYREMYAGVRAAFHYFYNNVKGVSGELVDAAGELVWLARDMVFGTTRYRRIESLRPCGDWYENGARCNLLLQPLSRCLAVKLALPRTITG